MRKRATHFWNPKALLAQPRFRLPARVVNTQSASHVHPHVRRTFGTRKPCLVKQDSGYQRAWIIAKVRRTFGLLNSIAF